MCCKMSDSCRTERSMWEFWKCVTEASRESGSSFVRIVGLGAD